MEDINDEDYGKDGEHEVILAMMFANGDMIELRHVQGWGLDNSLGIPLWIVHVDAPENHFQRYHFDRSQVIGIGVHVVNPPACEDPGCSIHAEDQAPTEAPPITEEEVRAFGEQLGSAITDLWGKQDHKGEPLGDFD